MCLCFFMCTFCVFWWILTEALPGSSIKHLEQQQTKATAYHRRKQSHEAINTSLLWAGSNLLWRNKQFEIHFVNKEDKNTRDEQLMVACDQFCFEKLPFFPLQNHIKHILWPRSNVSCQVEEFEWSAAAMNTSVCCNSLWMWFGVIVNGA